MNMPTKGPATRTIYLCGICGKEREPWTLMFEPDGSDPYGLDSGECDACCRARVARQHPMIPTDSCPYCGAEILVGTVEEHTEICRFRDSFPDTNKTTQDHLNEWRTR